MDNPKAKQIRSWQSRGAISINTGEMKIRVLYVGILCFIITGATLKLSSCILRPIFKSDLEFELVRIINRKDEDLGFRKRELC